MKNLLLFFKIVIILKPLKMSSIIVIVQVHCERGKALPCDLY